MWKSPLFAYFVSGAVVIASLQPFYGDDSNSLARSISCAELQLEGTV
jgi:hypothetical protein